MVDQIASNPSLAQDNTVQTTHRIVRLWEVDTLRGVAIMLMVFYHFVWDLNYFGLIQAQLLVGPWQWFARTIATMFIFTLGLSLTLSYNRAVQQPGQTRLFTKYLMRGLKIFGWGLVITVATYFFIGPGGFVIFGILHLLGFSVIAGYLFLNLNRWIILVAGVAVIVLGILFDPMVSDYPWFIWLGIKQTGRSMVDFYPVFPWFGPALLGMFVGYSLYSQTQRHFALPDWSDALPIRSLRFLGRHSLTIYLIHQPILIGLFLVLGYGSF